MTIPTQIQIILGGGTVPSHISMKSLILEDETELENIKGDWVLGRSCSPGF